MKNLTTTLCLTLTILLGSVGSGNTTDFLRNLEKETVSRLEFQLKQICGDLIRKFSEDPYPIEKSVMENPTRDVNCRKGDKFIDIFVRISGRAKDEKSSQIGRYITDLMPNKYAIKILRYFGNYGNPNEKNIKGGHIVSQSVFNKFQSRYKKTVESNPQILEEILEDFIPLIRITVGITTYNLQQTKKGLSRDRI